MAKKKTNQQVTITPQMQQELSRYADVFNGTPSTPSMFATPTSTPSNLSASQIEEIYNSTPTSTPSNLSSADIENIYNNTPNEIPTLQPISKNPSLEELQNLTSPLSKEEAYKHNYNNAINELQGQLADTNANRTEGETNAIQTYLEGLQGLQKEVDKYNRPKTTTTKKVDSKSYAQALGEKALELAKDGTLASRGYSLSPNEQRDLQRANNAMLGAYTKATAKQRAEQNAPSYVKAAMAQAQKVEEEKQAKQQAEEARAIARQQILDAKKNNVQTDATTKTETTTDTLPVLTTTNTQNQQVDIQKVYDDVKAQNNTNVIPTVLGDSKWEQGLNLDKLLATNEPYDPNENVDPIDVYTSSDYKLTKDDEQYARQWLNDYYQANPIAKKIMNTNNPNAANHMMLQLTPEQREEYQKAVTLENKLSNTSAIVAGALNAVPFFTRGESYLENKLGLDEKYNTKSQFANEQKQSPFAYTGGAMASKMAQYSAMNNLIDAIPALSSAKAALGGKIGGAIKTPLADIAMNKGTNAMLNFALNKGADKIGQSAANVLFDMIPDLLLDTTPEAIENALEGDSAGEVAIKALKNAGVNLGYNLGAEGFLKYVFPYIGKMSANTRNKLAEAIGGNNKAEVEELLEQATKEVDETNIDEILKQNDVSDEVSVLNKKLNPTTSSGANKILDDPELKFAFESENGVTLKGTKAEQRKQILDIVNSKTQNEMIDDIMKNTDDLNPLPKETDLEPEDAYKAYEEAQGNLNPLEELPKQVDEPIEQLAKDTTDTIKKVDEPRTEYVSNSSGQLGFIDYRGQYVEVNPNTGKPIAETLDDAKATPTVAPKAELENLKPIAKATGSDISEEAKQLYRSQYIQKWENIITDKEAYKKEFTDYINKFELEQGIEGAEAERIIDDYINGMERLYNAKNYKAAKKAYVQLDQAVLDMNDLLDGRSFEYEIDDLVSKEAYNKVIENLKGKTLYVSPQVKAEFPDGTFAMNKFGKNIRFTTDPKKGVSLDSLPDVKEALRGYVDAENMSDIDATKKLYEFLIDNKNGKKITTSAPYDTSYGVSLAENGDALFKQKLDQLGHTRQGKKLEVSKAYTNTGSRQGATDVEYAKQYNLDDFKYETTSDKESFDDAMKFVTSNSDENVAQYLKDKESWNHVDLDSAMIKHREYIKKAQELEKLGEDATEMWNKASDMFKQVQVQATKDAQVLQALAKWSKNTPEGQLATALNKIRSEVDAKFSKGYSDAIDRVSDEIKNILNKGLPKEETAKEVKHVLSYNLQFFASDVRGKIKGANGIANAIMRGGYTDDEIVKLFKKYNKVASWDAVDEAQVYRLLNEAQAFEKGSREANKLVAEAMNIFQKSLPSSIGNKMKTLMYDNMLASLKTMVTRNFASNVLYNTIEDSTKWEKALIDKGVGLLTGRRSHTTIPLNEYIKEGASGLWKGTKDTIDDFASGVHTLRSGEDGIENALRTAETAFKKQDLDGVKSGLNNALYYYDKTIRGGMELGDRPIYEKTYATVKAELTALVDKFGKDGENGLRYGTDLSKTNLLSNEELIEIYAREEALRSVMQNRSDFTEAMSGLKGFANKLSKGFIGAENGLLGQSSMPFTQIPGNMLDRMIDYTPVIGLARNIIRSVGESKTLGNVNQRRFVEELTHQINGTLMMAGATALAMNNKISGAYSSDSDKKKAQQENDYVEYGLQNMPWQKEGEITDISDVPVLGPMAVAGRTIYDRINEADGYVRDEDGNIIATRYDNAAKAIPGAITGAIAGVTQDSLFEGIERLTGNNSYSSDRNIFQNLGNTLLSSTNQLIPSFVRQYAQFQDPYKRDLGEYNTQEYYTNLFNNSLPGNWEMSNVPVLNQIPVLKDLKGREALPEKISTTGENVLQGSGEPTLKKAYETFLAPYKTSQTHFSDTYKEAERLEKETDSKTAYTPVIKKSDLVNISGYDASNYSNADLNAFRKDYYTMVENGKKEIYATSFYQNLSDAEKIVVNEKLNSAYKSIAKLNVKGSQYEVKNDKKLVEALQKNDYKSAINILSGSKSVSSASTSAKGGDEQYQKWLQDNNVSNSEKTYSVYKEKGTNVAKAYADIKAQENQYNSTATNVSIPYLEKANLSDADKGYVLTLTRDLSKGAEKAKQQKGDSGVYLYYKYKYNADQNGNKNGSVSKDEMLKYLMNVLHYSEADAKKIYSDWYK